MMIYSHAKFVLMDEPFGGLSPIRIAEIKELVKREASLSGKGFIITDHSYRDVLDAAGRILLMGNGSVRSVSGEMELNRLGYVP